MPEKNFLFFLFKKASLFVIIAAALMLTSTELEAKDDTPLNIIILEAYPITKGPNSDNEKLLQNIKKRLAKIGVQNITTTTYPWKRGLQVIENARNTVILPIDKTKDRSPSLNWIAPLLNVNFVVVSRGKKIESLYDALRFDRILVRSDSNYEYILRELGFPNITPVSSETMHKMLEINRAEAWFTSDVEAAQFTSNTKNIYISETLGVQKMWIAATADVNQEVLSTLSQVEKESEIMKQISSANKRQLSIASVDNPDMRILEELSSHYLEDNPNLEITWNLLPENQLRERVATDLISSDHEFDLITIGPYELADWGRKGWLKPFDNLPESYEEDDLFPRLRQSIGFGDHSLALPFYSETLVTYFRSDLVDKAGHAMPISPTYSDIERIASAIHNPSEGVYGICLRGLPGWGQNIGILTSIVKSFGGKWFDENWQSKVMSSEWFDAVKYYIDMQRRFGPPNASQLGHAELTEMFSEGKCGIWIDASVFSSIVRDPNRSKVYDKISIVLGPHQISTNPHWLWYWALAVPKHASHSIEAEKFAAWATSKEYIQLVAKTHGWLKVPPGTRRSTYNSEYEKQSPSSAIIKKAMEKTGNYSVSWKPSPNTDHQFIDIPEFRLIGTFAGHLIGEMLDGDLEIAEGLSKLHKTSNQILKQAGY